MILRYSSITLLVLLTITVIASVIYIKLRPPVIDGHYTGSDNCLSCHNDEHQQ
jgi:hypothetical protein